MFLNLFDRGNILILINALHYNFYHILKNWPQTIRILIKNLVLTIHTLVQRNMKAEVYFILLPKHSNSLNMFLHVSCKTLKTSKKKKCNLKKDLKFIISHIWKRYSLSICEDCNSQFLDNF